MKLKHSFEITTEKGVTYPCSTDIEDLSAAMRRLVEIWGKGGELGKLVKIVHVGSAPVTTVEDILEACWRPKYVKGTVPTTEEVRAAQNAEVKRIGKLLGWHA